MRGCRGGGGREGNGGAEPSGDVANGSANTFPIAPDGDLRLLVASSEGRRKYCSSTDVSPDAELVEGSSKSMRLATGTLSILVSTGDRKSVV